MTPGAEHAGGAINLLAIDDDPRIVAAISRKLAFEGMRVETSTDGVATSQQLEVGNSPWDVVVLDVQMPGISGIELLARFRDAGSMSSVIMLSGDDTAGTAAACMRAGAFHYLTKPFHASELVSVVQSAARFSRLRRQLAPRPSPDESAGDLVGGSPAMRRVRDMISRIAGQDVAILIQGESGTGKELAARLVHAGSPRADGPLVALNCGAIPEALIDSELFGHERGSFTGATGDRDGVFVEAHGGTLFLDEIGDMPLAVQARLLRVLEDGEVRPVGGSGTRAVDVRVIAATHVDLEQAVARDRFRKDLYYRLDVIVIAMPPLRERLEDVPELAARFLHKHGGPQPPSLSADALDALTGYRWPGNVRELENALIHAIAMRHGDEIGVEALPRQLRERGRAPRPAGEDPAPPLPLSVAKRQVSASFEREYLVQVMGRAQGSVAEAARLAGLDRTNFRRLLQRHGLDPECFK